MGGLSFPVTAAAILRVAHVMELVRQRVLELLAGNGGIEPEKDRGIRFEIRDEAVLLRLDDEVDRRVDRGAGRQVREGPRSRSGGVGGFPAVQSFGKCVPAR